jgi:hypothetical protein
VKLHHDELVERDRRVDEFHEQGMAAQHARGGIFAPPDESIPREERVALLREKLRQKIAEKNGEGYPG